MYTKAEKQQQLALLYAPYIKCAACPLGLMGRTNVVFGRGNPDAKLMFVGEGPGQQEDQQGQPFVGQAGKLLSKVFTLLDIDQSEIFITNVVKCRPPQNRKPTPLESTTCKGLLLDKQIEIINPTIICTLGATAFQSFFETPCQITKVRGTLFPLSTRTIIPTLHPAYILRNPGELEKMIFDIKKAWQNAVGV